MDELFSVANIIPGILFGLLGFFILRHAKQNSNLKLAVIGALLMIYPYFVAEPWVNWAIGVGLSVLAYRSANS